MNRLFTALTCLFLLSFFLFTGIALKTYLQGKSEEQAFEDLASSISDGQDNADRDTGSSPTPPPSEVREDATEYGNYTAYLSLHEQNPDFIGWLTIPGTRVDYPVMFTPEDPEYYLRRAFDRSASQSGTPFIGEGGKSCED